MLLLLTLFATTKECTNGMPVIQQSSVFEEHTSLNLPKPPILGAVLKKRRVLDNKLNFKLYSCNASDIRMMKSGIMEFVSQYSSSLFTFNHRGRDSVYMNTFGNLRIYPILDLFHQFEVAPLIFVCNCGHADIFQNKNNVTIGTVCPQNSTASSFVKALYNEIIVTTPKSKKIPPVCSVVDFFKQSQEKSYRTFMSALLTHF